MKNFANEFERELKDGIWQGIFWTAQPTPREVLGGGATIGGIQTGVKHCPCHGTITGGQEIMNHFDMEVEVITKFLEEKFGKVKILNVGEKFPSTGGHEMKLFTIRVEDEEGNSLLKSMTKEQLELIANDGMLINHMTGRLIQAKTEMGREHIKRNIECTGLLPDFTGEQ